MQEDCTNIYKKARKHTNLTQLEASELLLISHRSLVDYETGKTIPNCDTVCRMVKLYDSKWLAYKHLRQSTQVGSMFLPELDRSDLAQSVLRLQKEVSDVVGIKANMVEVACDGEVHDHEQETWNEVTKEITELIGAGLGVLFYQK